MAIPVIESVAEDAEVDVADDASTIASPSGLTTGDWLFPIVAIEADDEAASPFDDSTNKPTGCDLIDDFGEGGNVDVWGAAYSRQITGGESFPLAVAFNAAAAMVDFCGITLRASGVNDSNPVNVSSTPVNLTSAGDKIVTSATTTEDDCLGVAVMVFDGADCSPISLHTDSTTAGWSILAEHTVNTGAVGLTLVVATKEQATAGALGDCHFIATTADGASGFMFAIEGEATPAPGITVVGSETATEFGELSITVAAPAGLQEGDFVYIFAGGTPGVNWDGSPTGLTRHFPLSSSIVPKAGFYGFITGTPPADWTIQISNAAFPPRNLSALAVAFRGVHTTWPILDAEETSALDVFDPFNFALPQGSVTEIDNSLVVVSLVAIVGDEMELVTDIVQPSSYTVIDSIVNAPIGLEAAYLEVSSYGTEVNPSAWSVAAGSSVQGETLLFHLRPAGVTPLVDSISPDPLEAEGTHTVTVDSYTSISAVTVFGLTQTSTITPLSGTQFTFTLEKDLSLNAFYADSAAFGATIPISFLTPEGYSAPHYIEFGPPAGYAYVTMTAAYDDLPEESFFFGVTALSGLVDDSQVAYEVTADNLLFDGEMVLDASVELTAGTYDFDYYILDASDDFAAGTTGNIEFTVADTTPDAFSFTDATDVSVSTLTTSNTITVAGIEAPTAISVDAGEYRINAGSWTSAAGEVSLGDEVTLRITSSSSINTAVAITVDIGGVTDVWTVTTLSVAATGAVLSTAGDTITLTVEDELNIGAGGSGGLVLNTPSGVVTLSNFVAGGTAQQGVWDTSRVVYSNETPLTLSYTQPGDGIEDSGGNDLASFSGLAVTNNSTVLNPSIGAGDGAINSGIRGSLRTSLRGL